MAVPTTGSVSLRGIRREIAYNNYTQPVSILNVSLSDVSDGTNGTINSNSAQKPDGNTPHKMSEFRGYDHDASSGAAIGLSSSLLTKSGQYSSSSWETIGLLLSSDYYGKTVRLVWRYVSGTSYTGDIQIDTVSCPGALGQVTYNFDSSNNSFETTTSSTTSYNSASFSSVQQATSALRWNRRSGGTPSGSTGLSQGYGGTHYLYAETSSPGYSNKTFWLRSPEVLLSSSGILSIGMTLGRYGSTIGTLDFYLDVVS